MLKCWNVNWQKMLRLKIAKISKIFSESFLLPRRLTFEIWLKWPKWIENSLGCTWMVNLPCLKTKNRKLSPLSDFWTKIKFWSRKKLNEVDQIGYVWKLPGMTQIDWNCSRMYLPEGLWCQHKKNRKLPGNWQNTFWKILERFGPGQFWEAYVWKLLKIVTLNDQKIKSID